MSKAKGSVLLKLHMLLMLYSFSSVLSKLAARQTMLSISFVLCYGGMIALLGLYAIGWQQVIKRIPLTSAYANKAVTVAWGVVWGYILFGETASLLQLLGCGLVIAGVALFALADNEGGA